MRGKVVSLMLIAVMIPGLLMANPQEKVVKGKFRRAIPLGTEERLNLTDEQKEQIHKIKLEYQKKRIPLEAELKLARIELEELIRQGESEKKIGEAVEKVNGLRGKLFSLKINQRLDMSKLLTEEQKEKLKDCQFQKCEWFERRMHGLGCEEHIKLKIKAE
jgi:Spy/CpxP family protein refolding chaperone